MLSRKLTVIGLTISGGLCFSATPVATVSSTQSIVVSGIEVPTNRVISWPLSVNDEVTTKAPAMVRFKDGSVVTLQRNSRMRLQSSTSGVEVKVLAGSAIYDVKPQSGVSLVPAAASTIRVAPPTTERAAIKTPIALASRREITATALSTSAVAPSSGVVLGQLGGSVTTGTLTGTFTSGKGAQAATIVGRSDKITLANGTILEVHLVQGGNKSTYVIDKIDFPYTVPGDGTAYLTTPRNNPSPLIGATIMLMPPPPNGVLSQNILVVNDPRTGALIPPDQFQALLAQAAQSAFQDPANPFSAAGATPPPFPSPVNVGTFSAGS